MATGNLVKKVMLKIVAEDGDSKAKIDAITAKAQELGREHPELKLRVDSAAASAKLSVLRRELKDTATAAAGDDRSLRSRLISLSSVGGRLAGLPDVMGAFNSEASTGTRLMSGFSAATGLLEAPLAGLVVGVGGLAGGLAAAGTGMGAFGAVAKSVWGQASTAATAYAAAQKRVTLATTTAQRTSALQAEKAAMAGLSPPVHQLATEIGGVQSRWKRFTDAAAPGVVGVISQGLGLLPKVFAVMQPFLAPVEHALHGIIADVSHGLGSSGFKSFVGDMASNSGPAITKIGDAIGHVVVGIGGVVRAFLPMSQTVLGGVDKITAKFAVWGQTLTSHSGFQSLVSMAKTDMPYVITIVKNLGAAVVHLGSSMTGLSTFSNSKALLQLAAPLSELVNWLSKANPALLRMGLYGLAAYSSVGKVKTAVDGLKSGWSTITGLVTGMKGFAGGFRDAEVAAGEASGAWGTWGGKISSAMSSAGSMITGLLGKMGILRTATEAETVAQGELDVAMDANPIGLIVIAIGALVAGFALLWTHSKAFRDFWKGLWHDVQHIVGEAVSWIGAHWKLVVSILTGPIGAATVFIVGHWHQIVSGAQNMFHSVVSFFTSLPGRILSAAGNLGRLLWQGGVNLIMGLVHGIESVAMAPVHALGSIISGVRNLLPFSPAKTGPLSGSGSPDIAGRKIGQMLAQGIGASSPAVAAASARMAAMAGLHGGAAGGPGGAGGVLRLEVKGGGGMSGLDRLFMTWLQEEVRKLGGDPVMFQRKVAFA